MRGILFGFLVATMCLCGGHGALAEFDNDEDSDSGSCQGNCPEEDDGMTSSTSDASAESSSESSSDSNSESNSESSSDASAESDSSAESSSDNDVDIDNKAVVRRSGNSEVDNEVSVRTGQRATTGNQTINIDTPAPDVALAAKRAARHSERAGDVRSNSRIGVSPCGDSTGLSVQTGVAGGGMATVSETCRAYRLQQLQAIGKGSFSTCLATITHYAGWLPRTILHIASFGVLN